MSNDVVSPLRRRMIEDMNARKLCAGTQRGHIRSCKRFAAFLKRSPDTATLEDIRRFQLHLAEAGVSICTRNMHHDRGAVLVPRDAATIGSCRRDLSHPRAAEDTAGDERGRDEAPAWPSPAASRRAFCSVSAMAADCVPGRWFGSRSSTSTARRTSFGSSSRRAAKIAMSCCHPRRLISCGNGGRRADARHDAANTAAGTLAVSRHQSRQSDDHPTAQPLVP